MIGQGGCTTSRCEWIEWIEWIHGGEITQAVQTADRMRIIYFTMEVLKQGFLGSGAAPNAGKADPSLEQIQPAPGEQVAVHERSIC